MCPNVSDCLVTSYSIVVTQCWCILRFQTFFLRTYLIAKYIVGLNTLLQQGMSELVFNGDVVYKFKRIVGILSHPYDDDELKFNDASTLLGHLRHQG